jgi:long-chain acyl-CoA synthetase
MNLVRLLLRSARTQPERPALAVGTRAVLSYKDLASRVVKLSAALKKRFSLSAGDRVALAMKNCPQYYEVLFACWHAGLVAVPMNAKLHPKELAYILGHSGAKLCFTSPDLESAVPSAVSVLSSSYKKLFTENPEAACETGPDDPALELDALCKANIARFKRPREYRFVDALPKNNYGKVLKTELRRQLA